MWNLISRRSQRLLRKHLHWLEILLFVPEENPSTPFLPDARMHASTATLSAVNLIFIIGICIEAIYGVIDERPGCREQKPPGQLGKRVLFRFRVALDEMVGRGGESLARQRRTAAVRVRAGAERGRGRRTAMTRQRPPLFPLDPTLLLFSPLPATCHRGIWRCLMSPTRVQLQDTSEPTRGICSCRHFHLLSSRHLPTAETDTDARSLSLSS